MLDNSLLPVLCLYKWPEYDVGEASTNDRSHDFDLWAAACLQLTI